MTDPAPSLASVREALAGVFLDAASLDVERMVDGVSTDVFRITRGEERFYLRVLPETDSTFAPEVRAHQLARDAGATVPEVLYYEARSAALGRSIMLTTEIPGEPLGRHTPEQIARQVAIQAGRDLARINSIPVDGFGWVRRGMDRPPDCIAASHPTLRDFVFEDMESNLWTLAAHGIPQAEMRQIRATLRHHANRLDSPRAGLAHGDFDTTHIFVNESGYSGIIDLGEIRGAPRLYDLGHHRMHDRERLPYSTLSWLAEGYREVVHLPDDSERQIAFWSLLIGIRALARGLQRAPESQIVGTARRAVRRDLTTLATTL